MGTIKAYSDEMAQQPSKHSTFVWYSAKRQRIQAYDKTKRREPVYSDEGAVIWNEIGYACENDKEGHQM